MKSHKLNTLNPKLRLLSRWTVIVVLLHSSLACNNLSKQKTPNTPVTATKKIPMQSQGYTVQPNYDHPKFKTLSAAFDKEKHRFEIDCLRNIFRHCCFRKINI